MSKGIVLSEATHARLLKSAAWTEAQARTKQAVQFVGNRERPGGALPAPQYPGTFWGGVAANQAAFTYVFAINAIVS